MVYAPFGYLVDRTPYGASNDSLPPAFEDPTLVKLAKKYGKLTSQVVIRHLVIYFSCVLSVVFWVGIITNYHTHE